MNDEKNKNYPDFVNEFKNKFIANISHQFVFYYNIYDYVDDEDLLKTYLSKLFVSSKIVAYYDRGSGVTFYKESMKNLFFETMGMLPEKNDDAKDFSKMVENVTGETQQEELDLPKERSKVLPLLEECMKRTKMTLFVQYPESLIPSGTMGNLSETDRDCIVQFQNMAKSKEISEASSCVIILAKNLSDIHGDVRSCSECIKVPLPGLKERTSFLKHHKKNENVKFKGSLKQFANVSAGLSKFQIEDALLRTKFEEKGEVKPDFIRERKEEIIKSEYSDVLEVLEPRGGFEMVGGHQEIKNFLTDYVINPMKNGVTYVVPMGILMTGAPGTGKTILAEAVAYECKFNFVLLKPDKILNSLVGQSEKNLERALNLIETMSPCIVFIDEIDKSTFGTADSTRNLDSGVSANIARRIQEYMSDTTHRGKVIFLGATNYPNRLSPALKRAGRFDEKIPFLLPDTEDRGLIFEVMLKKHFKEANVSDEIDFIKLGGITEGYTGAEIERICLKAVRLARGNQVTQNELETAIRKIKKSTKDIEYMTVLALMECDDEDLIPDKYKNMYNNKEAKYKEYQKERKGRTEVEKSF